MMQLFVLELRGRPFVTFNVESEVEAEYFGAKLQPYRNELKDCVASVGVRAANPEEASLWKAMWEPELRSERASENDMMCLWLRQAAQSDELEIAVDSRLAQL
jgi:hypothetical protein